eukprot:2893917-Prymnesium_polylepis.1
MGHRAFLRVNFQISKNCMRTTGCEHWRQHACSITTLEPTRGTQAGRSWRLSRKTGDMYVPGAVERPWLVGAAHNHI